MPGASVGGVAHATGKCALVHNVRPRSMAQAPRVTIRRHKEVMCFIGDAQSMRLELGFDAGRCALCGVGLSLLGSGYQNELCQS